MDITQKFLYSGMSVTINAKKEFMMEALQHEAVLDRIVELLKKEEVRKRLCVQDSFLYIHNMMKVEITGEEIDYLFDELFGKKLKSIALEDIEGMNKYHLSFYASLFEDNGKMNLLDVTNYLTYAIVKSKRCVKQLYLEIEQANIYAEVMEAFEQSEYKNHCFEEVVEAKEVAASRLFRGLIVKFRQEASLDIYSMIMRIIYSEYKRMKKKIIRFGEINSEVLRTIYQETQDSSNKSILSGICEQVVLYVIADDLNINFIWDFSFLTMLKAVIYYEKEFEGKMVEEPDIHQFTEEMHNELKRAEDKYGSSDSLTNLIYGSSEECDNTYLLDIMLQFHISPRKFEKYMLTQGEIYKLMMCKEKWNAKDYMYCMVLAILCKYIYSLEKIVAEIDLHNKDIMYEQIEKLNKQISKQEELAINEKEKLREKEAEKNRLLLVQEREKDCLTKKVEEQQNIIAIYEQELAELRGYVYGLREDWNNYAIEESQVHTEFWQGKKIVVLGGHSNWQRKIKEKFPDWQFLAPDIKSFSTELIRDKEFIICNTDFLSHAAYYKVLAGRTKGQRILYVRNNNIDLCLRELEVQYRNQCG